LLTVKVATSRLFTIVHEPALSGAEHVPLDEYPGGTGASVAVHVGSPVKPVTVNVAGLPSFAGADAGEAVPLAQLTLTVTGGPPFGW
jgi:hypothetical protein